MMNDIYSLEYINKLSKTKAKSIVAFILIIVSSISLNIGLLFLTNQSNKIIMIIVLSLIFTLAAWFAIWLLIEGILFTSKKIEFIKNLFNSESKLINGRVIEIKKPITFSKAIRCYAVIIDSGQSTDQIIYVDEMIGALPIKKEDNVQFLISKNFAIQYDVLKDDEEKL